MESDRSDHCTSDQRSVLTAFSQALLRETHVLHDRPDILWHIKNAEVIFQSLIEGSSEHPLTFYGYGLCLIMMDEPEKARKWLRLFLDDPEKDTNPSFLKRSKLWRG